MVDLCPDNIGVLNCSLAKTSGFVELNMVVLLREEFMVTLFSMRDFFLQFYLGIIIVVFPLQVLHNVLHQ